MHYPNEAGFQLKRLRIEIHLDLSEHLKILFWGQLTTSANNITDGISSFFCSFEQLPRLSLANLIGEFCEFLQKRLEVKPLHFLAIQDGLTRDGLVVNGVLGLILSHDHAGLPFMLMERGHSLHKRRYSGDLLTHPSEQVSVDTSLYPCEVWQHSDWNGTAAACAGDLSIYEWEIASFTAFLITLIIGILLMFYGISYFSLYYHQDPFILFLVQLEQSKILTLSVLLGVTSRNGKIERQELSGWPLVANGPLTHPHYLALSS